MAKAVESKTAVRRAASRKAAPRKAARGKTAGRKARARVRVVVLEHGEGLPLPAYQSDDAAGLDLVAAVGADERVVIRPGARVLIPTGLVMELPAGFEGQVRPRSGLALKHGITVLNSPGTIDADYRGEVKVILVNLGTAAFGVERGERIAQLVVAPVTRAEVTRAKVLGATRRGAGGFGSTQGKAPPAASRAAQSRKLKKLSRSEK